MDLLLEPKQSIFLSFKTFFYLYNLKTDKIKYLLVPLHNWIKIGIEIPCTYKVYGRIDIKAICANKLKRINKFLIHCSFLYVIEI